MRAVVTVIGKDAVGILAKVSTIKILQNIYLSLHCDTSLLDIRNRYVSYESMPLP